MKRLAFLLALLSIPSFAVAQSLDNVWVGLGTSPEVRSVEASVLGTNGSLEQPGPFAAGFTFGYSFSGVPNTQLIQYSDQLKAFVNTNLQVSNKFYVEAEGFLGIAGPVYFGGSFGLGMVTTQNFLSPTSLTMPPNPDLASQFRPQTNLVLSGDWRGEIAFLGSRFGAKIGFSPFRKYGASFMMRLGGDAPDPDQDYGEISPLHRP